MGRKKNLTRVAQRGRYISFNELEEGKRKGSTKKEEKVSDF